MHTVINFVASQLFKYIILKNILNGASWFVLIQITYHLLICKYYFQMSYYLYYFYLHLINCLSLFNFHCFFPLIKGIYSYTAILPTVRKSTFLELDVKFKYHTINITFLAILQLDRIE